MTVDIMLCTYSVLSVPCEACSEGSSLLTSGGFGQARRLDSALSPTRVPSYKPENMVMYILIILSLNNKLCLNNKYMDFLHQGSHKDGKTKFPYFSLTKFPFP